MSSIQWNFSSANFNFPKTGWKEEREEEEEEKKNKKVEFMFGKYKYRKKY